MSNTQHTNKPLNSEIINDDENDHSSYSAETPLRPDAFDLSDSEKIKIIESKFRDILETMGLDLTDDSLQGTPRRVAKMYIEEIFSGLNPTNKPSVKLFKNTYNYDDILIEKNIMFHSNCEHHFVPIYGKAHVAYIPNKKVVGLSKINRIVKYFSKRPQVQERLTIQILNEMKSMLDTEDVAVVIEADHMCVASRGVNDTHSSTVTSKYSGKFLDPNTKKEFLTYIK